MTTTKTTEPKAPTTRTRTAKPKAEPTAPAKTTRTAKPKPEQSTEPKLCLCGCGDTVSREFRPGHDARFKGQLVRAALGGDQAAAATLAGRSWTKFLDAARARAAAKAADTK